MDGRPGRYLGTEIDEKWWKRYTKEGFFTRGNGEYWYDDEAFYFLRYLTQDPVVIPFDKVDSVKVGTWHAGRWAWGNLIIKLLWVHQGQSLSSGFILSYQKPEALRLLDEIRQRVSSPISESAAQVMVDRAIADFASGEAGARRARWGNGCVESVYSCVCGHGCPQGC